MHNLKAFCLLSLCLAAILALLGCDSPPALHQVSTLQALAQGAYEGQVPVSDLPGLGTLCIGTFDALDGELILLDDRVYQATADGRVIPNPTTTTPFADVVRFAPQTVLRDVNAHLNMEELLALLEANTGSKNLLYAVRIDGLFQEVTVRSIPRQTPPYPTLAGAAKQQRVFELQDVRGTLVGFRFPEYMNGVNMPGWHLHFIADDRSSGGHVLALKAARLTLQLQTIRRFDMVLPAGGTFVTADLAKDISSDIRRIEK